MRMTLEQAKILLEGVREALQRKELPSEVRASLKRAEVLGRKSVAAKIALARRPDYVPQPPRPSALPETAAATCASVMSPLP